MPLGPTRSTVPLWWSIRTSNQKVLGSTPDRSTRIFYFRVCLCHGQKENTVVNFFYLSLISLSNVMNQTTGYIRSGIET